jgi:Fic family protein
MRVVLTGPAAAVRLGVSEPTIYNAIRHLEELDILREMTGGARRRVWAYGRYLAALNEGT